MQLYNIAFYAPNNFSNGPSLRFIYHPTFYNTWPMLSLFAVMADLKWTHFINPQLSTPKAVVVIFLFIQECFIVVVIFFYSRVFHVPLNLNIFNQKHIIVFDLRPFKRTVHESFKLDLFDITTKNTLKVMIHLFTRVLQTPNSEHLQPKAHFCDLRLYKRTFYKSFKSL